MNDFEHDGVSSSHERPINPNPDKETSKQNEAADDGLPNVGKIAIDYKKKIGMGVFGVILLSVLFATGHHSDKKEENANELKKNERIIPDYTAQKKVDVPASKPLAQTPSKSSPDELALQKMKMVLEIKKQEMEMKREAKREALYQMRLKSPMDLIKEDNGTAPSVSSAVALSRSNVTNAESSISRLPLTPQQISALSQAQSNDPNEAFQKKGESSTVANATAERIPYFNETITQGTMIPANLETEINSDLPGQIKAVISEDVYSADGSHKLLSKGDELVGAYNSGVLLGQRRVMAMWTQVTRHDGVRVLLGSPGTDSLAMSGFDADVLQTHFWERFGGATLVSIVGGLVATAGVEEDAGYNSASDYRMMMSQNFQQTANSQLLAGLNRKPTIVKYQGAAINVFVNRDLSFHDVGGASK